jgi:hypothetical protein
LSGFFSALAFFLGLLTFLIYRIQNLGKFGFQDCLGSSFLTCLTIDSRADVTEAIAHQIRIVTGVKRRRVMILAQSASIDCGLPRRHLSNFSVIFMKLLASKFAERSLRI